MLPPLRGESAFDHTLNRVLNSEAGRAKATGFGTGKQGTALVRHYLPQLNSIIHADRRAKNRDRAVWRALRGMDDYLGPLLLTAGVTICGDDKQGADKRSGLKTFRSQAWWLGAHFGDFKDDRKLRLKVGAWGLDKLSKLPLFEFDGEVLSIPPDTEDDLLNSVILRSVAWDPFLFPVAKVPEPWTQIRTGVLPPDHWARLTLVSRDDPAIQSAVSRAISDGRMDAVLSAVNFLRAIPFAINEPILNYVVKFGTAAPLDIVTAESLAEWGQFYIPHELDFRGRLYGIPHFSFSREDQIRGLFLFANGEPIGVEGLAYLKAHVAKSAGGNSNLNFEQRVAWTDQSIGRIYDVPSEYCARNRSPIYPTTRSSISRPASSLSKRWTRGRIS